MNLSFLTRISYARPFRKKVHVPSALYNAYEKSGDTEEKAKSGVSAGIDRKSVV